MKTIDLSRESRSLDEVLSLASDEGLVLRTSDGREFLLAEVDDLDDELDLIRRNKELMQFLESRSKTGKKFALDEVRRELGI